MKTKKSAFIAGFTGILLTGFIVKMPSINAEDGPLCLESADTAITTNAGETYLTGNCTLSRNFNGNLLIGSNITATLNLNNKTLSSASGVTLKNLGNLTILGEGTISGNNNYAVQNLNTMRIEGGSYIIDSDSNASVVANGWNLTPSAGATPAEKPANSANYATLEIAGGHFTGKINNVKNDENGIMKVSGGLFDSTSTSSSAASILHGGKSLEITGGNLTKRILVQSMGVDKQKTLAVSGGTVFNIAFDTAKNTIDPEVSHDVLLTGGHLSANLPSAIKYGQVEVHDFSGGSFTYSGSSDTKINAYNLNLSGSFSVNNGDVTEVTLRDSTVGQFSSINKGSLEVTNIDATSGGYIKSANGVIDIYSGQIGKTGKKIQTTNNGTINIHDGYVYGELNPTNGPINIYDGYIFSEFNPTQKGVINVFGGKFLKISEDQIAALTTAVENGNTIAGTNKELIEYQDGEETWYYVGNRETNTEIENTDGKVESDAPIESVGPIALSIEQISDEDLATLKAENNNLRAAFDINLTDDTNQIISVVNNNLKIRLNLPAEHRGYDNYEVAYIENGKIKETFKATATNDYLTFNSTHLTVFGIIAYNNQPSPDKDEEPTPKPDDKPTPKPDEKSDNKPTPKPDEKPTPKPANKPEEEITIIIDDEDVPVPYTSENPSVPNTGSNNEGDARTTLLWTTGFLSVIIAGVLALIKKSLNVE